MRQKIQILDENDNRPLFEQQFYQASIPVGTLPNAEICRVFASDSDSGENGRLSYHISESLYPGLEFFIEPVTGIGKIWIFSKVYIERFKNSGIIRVNDSVVPEMENLPLIELKIQARDYGNPPLASYTTVHVQIVGKSQEIRYHFSQSVYKYKILIKFHTNSYLLIIVKYFQFYCSWKCPIA